MGYVVADGKSNWLEGVILICGHFHPKTWQVVLTRHSNPGLYIIVAVSFWFYPGKCCWLSFHCTDVDCDDKVRTPEFPCSL